MAQSILQLLSQSRGGVAYSDADEFLVDVVKAVRATGKKGHVNIKIEVEPDKTTELMVAFQPEVTAKIPKRPYAKSFLFVNEQTGELSREDPRQLEMELERKAKLAEQGATAINQVGRG